MHVPFSHQNTGGAGAGAGGVGPVGPVGVVIDGGTPAVGPVGPVGMVTDGVKAGWIEPVGPIWVDGGTAV